MIKIIHLKIKDISYGKKTKAEIPYTVVAVEVLDPYWSKRIGQETAFCLFDTDQDKIDFKINDHINIKSYRIKQGREMKMICNVTTWEII